MEGIELYSFFLCLIVFLLLTGVFTFFIITLIKLNTKLVYSGSEDESVKKEQLEPPHKSRLAFIETAVSLLLCILFISSFIFSVYVCFQEEKYFDNIPTINVVASGSMEKKHEVNTYLTEYNLNDQFDTFDLILTYKVPPADELKKFDIVVYEAEGLMIIHRIIDIEPPNKAHPDEYWFTCKGDAMERTDRFPVKYNQIKGIYRGQRIPFVGSFVAFMQSPAGILCILLILFGFIATPIAEKKFEAVKKKRYTVILELEEEARKREREEEERRKALLFAQLASKKPKTFRQKLRSDKNVRNVFKNLKAYIEQFEGVRLIESDKYETFKRGNAPIAKFTIRGKTLNAYLALDPAAYSESKYVFTDVSDKASHKSYPMLVKLSSQRQIRWTKELIDDIANNAQFKRKENQA